MNDSYGKPDEAGFLRALGTRVKTLREAAALSRSAVANEVGCDVDAVLRLEAGELDPTLQELLSLARVLRVSVAQLVSVATT